MTIEFRTPEMTASDPAVRQVLSYLYQLAQQLNYAFSVLETGAGTQSAGGEDAQTVTRNLVNQRFHELDTKIGGMSETVSGHGRKLERLGQSVALPDSGGMDLRGQITINGEELEAYVKRLAQCQCDPEQ